MKKTLSVILSMVLIMTFAVTSLGITSIVVDSIKANTNNITLQVGKTYALKVTVTPADATNKKLTYSSGNKNIATVDKNGKIKGMKAGKTVITVASSSNRKAVEKCKVTVSQTVEVKMSVAGFVSKGTPDIDGLEYIKKILEERSKGRIKVNVFYGGTVGGESETIEQVRAGTIQLSIGGFSTISKYAGELCPWIVPYFFPDKESMRRSWDGRIGQAMREKFDKSGMIFAGFYLRGNRQLTSNRKVVTPQDAAGMKIRLPETKEWIEVWKELGCLPVPIPAPEVFSALQTGVVDAQENPIASIYQKRLWEVQKYISLTNHIVDMNGYFISRKWFDGLDIENQDLILQAVKEALALSEKITDETEAKLLEDMKKKGMTVITPDMEAFRKKAAPAMERIKSNWEPWVYDEAIKCISGK